MAAQPGDEPGNVVAWKDFKKPENIPDEEFTMDKRFHNFRIQSSKCVKPEQALFFSEYCFKASMKGR